MSRRVLAFWFALGLICGLVAPVAPAFDGDKPEPPAAKSPADAEQQQRQEQYYELFKTLVDVMDQVERNYVEKVSREELLEAAIRGVMAKLDPYSNYIRPEHLDRFRNDLESEFGGIGIQLGVLDGKLKVISPLVGTPAYRAGILAGDTILEINGKSAAGISMDEAQNRLLGKAGTEVRLTIQHEGEEQTHTITLRREIIRVETVLGDRRNDKDAWDFMIDVEHKIGYIRLTAFSRETTRDLRRALRDLTEQGMRGLVLDLRFNPGGLLTTAVEVADLFISEGRIVGTEDRNGEKKYWDAVKDGTFEGFAMAVLINRYSASASEIVAACLQDHQRAVVVGERSWGKGSVQNVVELAGGGALKLTTAGYYRPSGKNIHRREDADEDDEWGVVPNEGYALRLDSEEMSKLVLDRRDRDIIRARPLEKPETPFVDRQLKMALQYVMAEAAKKGSVKPAPSDQAK
jgi:carboxyl-terminal processing protease